MIVAIVKWFVKFEWMRAELGMEHIWNILSTNAGQMANKVGAKWGHMV